MRKRTSRRRMSKWLCLAVAVPCATLAQQVAPQRAVPPRSAPQQAVAQQTAAAPQQTAAAPQADAGSPDAAMHDRKAATPQEHEKAVARAAARKGGAEDRKGGKAMDRLELGTTDITGNRELPKVMYIVPWKRSDLGDLTGKPLNSLIDQTLQPVDRDVFRRQNAYYRAVSGGRAATGGAAPQADRRGAQDADRSAGGDARRAARDER